MKIYWSELSWEAFATLMTGIIAVVGAVWIGFKQSKIQMQLRQLSETNLRIQLLDRRRECISQMREVHNEWLRDGELSSERWRQFQSMFFEAELLFSKEIVKEMDATLDGLFWKEHWHRRSIDYYQQGKEGRAKEKLDQSFAEDDKVFKLMPTLLEKLKSQTHVADWY